jgi:hypothetical protein
LYDPCLNNRRKIFNLNPELVNKNIRGAGTLKACTRVQLNRLPAAFSQPVHIPSSNVQSFGPGGFVVLGRVDVVVGTRFDGSAFDGVKTHGFSKIRRSSIAVSP